MGVRRVAELDSHLSSSGFPGELEVLHLSCCFVSACNVPGPLGERFERLRSYYLNANFQKLLYRDSTR